MAPLKALAERPASYLSEADYFQDDWQGSFWGDHYTRLARVKDRYDPGGLFSCTMASELRPEQPTGSRSAAKDLWRPAESTSQ